MKALAGPVGLLIVGLGLVVGVGYWSKYHGTAPAKEGTQPAKQATSTPAPVSSPPAPVTPAAPAPVAASGPNSAILEARRHIDRSNGDKETMKVVAVYIDGLKEGAVLQPVEILVPKSASTIFTTAQQVVNPPASEKLFSDAPPGTKVNSANFDKSTGVATVDLSSQVQSIEGSGAAFNFQASLVYSLTSISGVKSVMLKVNGRAAMLHEIEWSKPLSRSDLEARNAFKMAPVIHFEPKS